MGTIPKIIRADMYVNEKMKIGVYGIKNLGIIEKRLKEDTKIVILHKGDPDNYKIDMMENKSTVHKQKSLETQIYQNICEQVFKVRQY